MGAFAVRKDQIFDTEALGIFPNVEKRVEFEQLSDSTGVIVVSQMLKDTLRPEHLAAIIAHEQAHIDCGHIHRINEKGEHGIINNIGYEIQADLGAAAVTGAKNTRKALVATCAAIVNALVVEMGMDADARRDVNRKVINSIKPRIAALRAYK
jgi:Zn-dependent protease with chaperone function